MRKETPSDFAKLTEGISDQKAVQALADLQEELAELKDKRREERLGWIVFTVIVVDCFLFLDAKNWSGPVIIGLLQIGALSVIAKRLGVEEFGRLFANMLGRASHLITGKD